MEEKRRVSIGGLAFAGIGLVLVVVSLLVPWLSTTVYVSYHNQSRSVDVFGLGASSLVYALGTLPLLVGFGVATSLREPARRIAGVCGIAASVLPVTALAMINRGISGAVGEAAEREADLERSGSGSDDVAVITTMDAGFLLGTLGVLCLVLAVCRAAWPGRPVLCYAGFAAVAAGLAVVVPWAYLGVVEEGQGAVLRYWFVSFGGAGAGFGVAVAVAWVALGSAGTLERQSWWPAPLGLAAMVTAMVCVFAAELRATAGALLPEDAVVNTGFAAMWLLSGTVLACCATVTAIRGYRRSRRSGPAVSPTSAPAIR